MRQLQQSRLGIVVACANRKRLAPAPGLSVRELPDGARRAAIWAQRLARAQHRVPLGELYVGAHWRSCLDLAAAAASARSVEMWVMSAGLGLQPVTAHAPGYGATFAAGPDNISRTAAGKQAWWRDLADRCGSTALAEVADRNDELLVVLSPDYLQVLAPELKALPVAATAVSSEAMSGLDVLSSAGLGGVLGGSALTLNQRAAARFLQLSAGDRLGSPRAHERWRSWADGRRATRTWNRERLDDTAVRALIREWVGVEQASATVLLRRLRTAGYACEQSRFAQLYRQEVVVG